MNKPLFPHGYVQKEDILRRMEDAELHGNTNLLAILKLARDSSIIQHNYGKWLKAQMEKQL